MKIASASGIAAVVLLATAGAASPTHDPQEGADEMVVHAVEVPAHALEYASPEDAALAAAAVAWGAGEGRVAEVVFVFPEPDDYDVRVRVSDDFGFCRIFGAWQIDLDGSARAGWISSGAGNDYC